MSETSSAVESNSPKESVEFNLSLIDILDYVRDSVRPIRQGCLVFDSRHIVCLGYTEHKDQCTKFTAFVIQSSHPNLVPHTVQLEVRPNVGDWILKCSCKAGNNKCKHIVACLLYLNRVDEVEYLTCTDAKMAWDLSKSGKTTAWGAKRIADLCCVKKATIPQETDKELKQKILADVYNRILNVAKDSAFAKHRLGRVMNSCPPHQNRALQSDDPNIDRPEDFCSKDVILQMVTRQQCIVSVADFKFNNTEDETYFKSHVDLNCQQIAQTAIDTQTQSTNIWKVQRACRITASSCYELYTYLNNKNPDWSSKIERYWNTKNIKTAAMLYGKETEHKAFRCYKIKRNPMIQKCGLVVKDHESWFAASPDGVDHLNDIILEIKCPVVGELNTLDELIRHSSVGKYLKSNPETSELYLNKNHSYYCQVQMNMWALQCPSCDFVVYCSNLDDFVVVEVAFDHKYVETIINRLKELYTSKMLPALVLKAKSA